jgi:AcrR family transcriptional regulator
MAPRTPEQNMAIRDQRQAQILEAACEVYLEHGARGTEMKLVAERAGVGKGTVYHYFPGKRDLLRALFESSLEDAKARMAEVMSGGGDPLELLRRFCRGQLLTLIREPHLFRFFKSAFEEASIIFGDEAEAVLDGYREAVQVPVMRLFQQAAESGEIVPMSDPTTVRLFWGAMIGAVTVYFEGTEIDNEEELADRALGLLFDGIRSPLSQRGVRQ